MDKCLKPLATVVLIWAFLVLGSSAAAPLQPDDVPDPLKPWIDWVVADDKQRLCPFLYNNFASKRCAWPGELQRDLRASAGAFSGTWRVFADSWIVLPGDLKRWPATVEN